MPVVEADFGRGDLDHAGGRTGDQQRIADAEGARLHLDLRDAQPGVVVRHASQIDFRAGGLVAVHRTPFAQPGALVVAVPETAVEDRGEPRLERSAQFRGERPGLDGVGRFAVGPCDRLDILAAARPPFDLEDRGARIGHLVEKFDGAQVFGRHDILVVDQQL